MVDYRHVKAIALDLLRAVYGVTADPETHPTQFTLLCEDVTAKLDRQHEEEPDDSSR